MADLGQSFRGGDDSYCGDVRRHLSHHPHGPGVAVLLDHPLPQRARAVDQFPLAAGLGFRRHQHLLPDLPGLLVRGSDPGSRHAPRPRPAGMVPSLRRPAQSGLERVAPDLASLRGRVPAAGRVGDAAGRLSPLHCECGLRRHPVARLAFHHLSALLRDRSHLLRHGHGPDPDARGPQGPAPGGLPDPAPYRRHGQAGAGHELPGGIVLRH